MGIHDRDYYRPTPRWSDSFNQFLASGFVRPMMGVLIIFFLIQVAGAPNQTLAKWLGLDALQVWPGGQIWRLVTYCLIHSTQDLLTFVVNCYVLWSFGKMVEEEIGIAKSAVVFFASVFIGGLVYCVLVWSGFRAGHNGCLGSAAGITALLVMAAWKNPHASILLFFVLPIQLWVAVATYVGIEVLLLANGPGVVPEIPLAGAIFATVFELSGRSGWFPPAFWRTWKRSLFKPKLRVFRDEAPMRKRREPTVPVTMKKETASQRKPDGNKFQEEEMDRILEKISASGMHSLSEEEKRFLLSASDRLKNQRKN